jgi:hypothetical protein
MGVKDPREVGALVQVLDTHPLATDGQLGGDMPDGRRPPYATLRVDYDRTGPVVLRPATVDGASTAVALTV